MIGRLSRLALASRVGAGKSASDPAKSRPASFRFFSKKLFGVFLALFLCFGLLSAEEAKAGFASGFSLGVGEEYNDNLFFSNERKPNPKLPPGVPLGHTICPKCDVTDFITHIVPTVTLLYAPPSEITPTFNASFSTEGQIFARNSSLNNFGDNISLSSGYTYRYSPRMTFHVGDSFNRVGAARTAALEVLGPPQQLPITPTQQPAAGAFTPVPLVQDVGSLVTEGSSLGNFLSVEGAYLYSPNITLSGSYGMAYSNAGDRGELSNSIGIRGVYNWRQEHNFHAGYAITFLSSNGGNASKGSRKGSNVIHSIDLGDDYFSGFKIQLDPTLTLSAASGIGINTGGRGPAIANNLSLTLIKLWQTAVFNAAVRRGLTGSFGISGVSNTTSISSNFGIRLTERLTASSGLDYSMFDTDDGKFSVFRASAGLQYWLTTWISSNLWYSHRWRHADLGSNSNNKVSNGDISGNSVLLAFAFHFDLWPDLGLARGATHPLYQPMGAPGSISPEFRQPLRPPPTQPQPPASQPPATQFPGSP